MSRAVLVTNQVTRRVVETFKSGDSVHTIAKRELLAVQTIERLIRSYMIDGPTWRKSKGASRA